MVKLLIIDSPECQRKIIGILGDAYEYVCCDSAKDALVAFRVDRDGYAAYFDLT